MKRFFIIAAVLVTSFLLGCSQPFMSQLYFLQQAEYSEEISEGSDWDNDDSGIVLPEEPAGSISIFSLIGPDGSINESAIPDDPEIIQKLKERIPVNYSFSSTNTARMLVRSRFTAENVPVIWYEEGNWEEEDLSRNEWINRGPDTTAGSNSISNVRYFAYMGLNPFFNSESSYNTQNYNSEGNRKMERFVFYRFTGDTALPSLDNMLVAVDTYTRLFFCFGKPVEYKSYFGQNVPVKWAPVDSVSKDSDGKSHPFYEYDPAGYVDERGQFIQADWYETGLAAGNYDPRYTGLSPYSIKTNSGEAFSPTISVSRLSAGILQDEESGLYYTEITISPQSQTVVYRLYRLDNRSDQWLEIDSSLTVPPGEAGRFRDPNALFLDALPLYKVAAYTSSGDLIGESEASAGSRMLTSRELLYAAMESIRKSFEELWYQSGSITGSLSKGFINGAEGQYHHGIDRDGFFGTNYRRYQSYNGFSNSPISLNGTFMKDEGKGAAGMDKSGLWTHYGSNWPKIEEFPVRTDSLIVSFEGVLWNIVFHDIRIDNNDGDKPDWISGYFTVKQGSNESVFGKDDALPFALFMSPEVLRTSIKAESYAQ